MEKVTDHQYSSRYRGVVKLSETNKTGKVCPVCSKELPPNSNLSFHMMLHPSDKPFACDFCLHIFKTKDDLWEHYGAEHPSKQSNVCETCGKSFRHIGNLRRHIGLRHSDVMKYKCIYCDAPFKEYGYYRMHQASHDRVTNFQCDICNVYFGSRKTLEKHVEKCQSFNQILECCQMTFYNRMDFVEHTLEKHKKYKQVAQKCKFCEKTFPYVHMKKAHEGECKVKERTLQENSGIDVPPLRCDLCDRVFSTLRYLMNHMRVHTGKPAEKKFTCNICNKKLSSYSTLYVHRAHHLNIKKHFCDVCNKGFLHRAMLVTHRVVHTKEKPFKCDQCDKSFSYKTSRRVHERVHAAERRFSCQYCNMTFTRLDIKNIHERRHTGEKPFSCKICGKTFSQDSTCKQHERTHNDAIDCEHCGRQFITRKEFKTHRRGGQCMNSDNSQEFEVVEETIAVNQLLESSSHTGDVYLLITNATN